ncbi:hypothetical protein [Victivallis vadensis]|uniref:lysophospholipid acyltransferase family protein n=1 Tax=Victivallis vadensis TaxID=172901 RepID=UPI002595DAE6|nr:hypothetical protein [Victivallis vadensis]
MKVWRDIRYRIEYAGILIPYRLIRILPYSVVRGLGLLIGNVMNLVPMIRKVVRANIHAAMPELPAGKVAEIGRESLRNLAFNMLEFIWLDGKPERIRRCYVLPPDVTERLKGHVERNERIIFVNPHLGSWEASGVMAPFYAGVKMVAIARPIRNYYINRLFNQGNREKVPGLEIIFSEGAVRAAIKALKSGRGVGTLIDQNTKGRYGGTFVNFFNIPVASSTAPANLKSYCDAHDIPAVIIYGTSVRHADGKVYAHSAYLPKPFHEYKDEVEVLQALMDMSEEFIRKYPDQYLWFYRRFQYIPQGATDEVKAKYPFYAKMASNHFMRANQE